MKEQQPWKPAAYTPAQAFSIKAVAAGTADAEQQRMAVQWILEEAAGTHAMSYRPGGEEGRRDSDFAEGQRSVGLSIVKLIGINPQLLRRNLNEPTEQS